MTIRITVGKLRNLIKEARQDMKSGDDIPWAVKPPPNKRFMNNDIRSHLSAVVADYTGREVLDINVHSDPKVPGTFAIRAEVAFESSEDENVGDDESETIDLLLTDYNKKLSLASLSANIQDVQFAKWPPTISRNW
jgi:hypothetical protein